MDISFLLSDSFLLASYLSAAISVLYVAIGLGMVIFIHELGHFAVAKWCDVYVEGFSVGFGPAIWSKKYGETVYAIRALPLGGFVKMLGQDDANPSEMTDESIADDPRSYTAKNVPQRMAIISAGVIMNVISGALFFALAYFWGVQALPSNVGPVLVGSPAYEEGLTVGDEIKTINGKKVKLYSDILRSTIFAGKNPLEITGVHADGTEFSKTIYPKRGERRRQIGVARNLYPKLPAVPEEERGKESAQKYLVSKNFAGSKANPPFQGEDEIIKIGDQEINSYSDLRRTLAAKSTETLTFVVKRKSDDSSSKEPSFSETEIEVPPQPFRTLGLWLEIGKIESLVKNYPAAKAGLKKGDKIIRVDSVDVGTDINPMRLPEYFASKAGETVKVDVLREVDGDATTEVNLEIVPNDTPAWFETPMGPKVPMSIPAIGVAYHLIPTVLKVEEGSPADGKISAGTRLEEIGFIEKTDSESEAKKASVETLKLKGKDKNWAYAFWLMQQNFMMDVQLTVSNEDSDKSRKVTLSPADSEKWFLPVRGIKLTLDKVKVKGDNFGDAFSMGMNRLYSSIFEVYLTLKSLFNQEVSYKELHGPLGIAAIAYHQASQGIPDLLLFMGMISINLAVINFLPIPVLDGGHMVFLAWEGITRKKPSEKVVIAATLAGLVFVLGLMLTVFYLDIFEHGMLNFFG